MIKTVWISWKEQQSLLKWVDSITDHSDLGLFESPLIS